MTGTRITIGIICATIGFASWTMTAAKQPAPATGKSELHVGIYDNRAITEAYAPSKYNPVDEKMKEYEKAKADGDSMRVKELEAWGGKHQRQLHRQGFSRVPVDDLLAHVKDQLPEVARRAGVDVIAWQCDYTSPNVELVDITKELVLLFEPSDKTLKFVDEILKLDPIDLDVLEQHHEH